MVVKSHRSFSALLIRPLSLQGRLTLHGLICFLLFLHRPVVLHLSQLFTLFKCKWWKAGWVFVNERHWPGYTGFWCSASCHFSTLPQMNCVTFGAEFLFIFWRPDYTLPWEKCQISQSKSKSCEQMESLVWKVLPFNFFFHSKDFMQDVHHLNAPDN